MSTVTAYLDAEGDVIARAREIDGHTTPPVGQVTDAVERVAGAPMGLVRKGRASASGAFFHRKISGDGTDLSHYIQVEDLEPLKSLRKAEFDATTRALMAQGFVYLGDTFSLSFAAQANFNSMRISEDEAIYPVKVSTLDNSKVIQLADKAALQAFYGAGVRRGYVQVVAVGNNLKDDIDSAITKADIDAIVETR